MEITAEATTQLASEDFVRAAHDGDEEKVKKILQGGDIGVDIEYNSETPLLSAARKGHVGTCRILLNHGANCNKIICQKTPLWIAALHRNINVVEVMLATQKCTRENLDKTFLLLAEMDHFHGCKILLEAGASVNTTGQMQLIHYKRERAETNQPKPTALHFAADKKNEEFVKFLIEKGANANATAGNLKKTPLHLAIANGSVGVLDILLGVPNLMPNITDSEDNTPLMTAIKMHKKDCVRAFFKHDCWAQCMSVKIMTDGEYGTMDTPMRLMICHMPDVAMDCMDQCVELSSHQDSKHPDFKARFSFAFLDDTYTSTNWTATTGPNASSESVDANTVVTIGTDADGTIETANTTYTGSRKKRRSATDHWATRFNPSVPDKELRLECDPNCFRCVSGIKTSRCQLKEGAEPYSGKTWSMKMNHPLMIAYQEKATGILCHPLAVALIDYKWRKVGRFFCYGRLLVMLLFVGLLTTQVFRSKGIIEARRNRTQNTTNIELTKPRTELHPIDISLVVLTVILLLQKVVAIRSQPAVYFSRLGNYKDLFLYVSVIILVFSYTMHDIPYNLAAICVFLAWFNTSLTLRKLPVIGIFFVMFTKILKNSTVVLLIFIPIFLGFAFTFCILLDTFPLFSIDVVIATVIVMLSGEVEYVDTMTNDYKINHQLKDSGAIIFAYVAFIVVMVICLLNLLVGIAVSDVDNLRSEAEGEMMTMKAEEVLSCEFYLPRFLRRRLARGCLISFPNRTTLFPGRTEKAGQALRKKIKTWTNMLDFGSKSLSAEILRKTKTNAENQDDPLRREITHLGNKIDRCLSQLEMCLRNLPRHEYTNEEQAGPCSSCN